MGPKMWKAVYLVKVFNINCNSQDDFILATYNIWLEILCRLFKGRTIFLTYTAPYSGPLLAEVIEIKSLFWNTLLVHHSAFVKKIILSKCFGILSLCLEKVTSRSPLLRIGFKWDAERETNSLFYSMFSAVNHQGDWRGGVAF